MLREARRIVVALWGCCLGAVAVGCGGGGETPQRAPEAATASTFAPDGETAAPDPAVEAAEAVDPMDLPCRPGEYPPAADLPAIEIDDDDRIAILIVLDAARYDRFSGHGHRRSTTPAMDQLAARSAVFDHHYSAYTYTRRAVPALLYSRYFPPSLFTLLDSAIVVYPDGLLRGPDLETPSMATALRDGGFRTGLVSAHPWIGRGNPCVDDFDDVITLPQVQDAVDGASVVDHAIRWLAEHPGQDRFLYLHLMDPHSPYLPGECAREFAATTDIPPELIQWPVHDTTLQGIGRRLTPLEQRYIDAVYDGGLRFADLHLARLFDALGPALERSLVVITADHGEALGEAADRYSHGIPSFETVARIPLIVHHPPPWPRRGSRSSPTRWTSTPRCWTSSASPRRTAWTGEAWSTRPVAPGAARGSHRWTAGWSPIT